MRKCVMGLVEQWLMVGITAAERLEADGLIGQIDLTPNQAMGPPRIDVKDMANQTVRAGFGSATYEDHHPLGISLKIGLPGEGKVRRLGAS